jgi:hypothetical protein
MANPLWIKGQSGNPSGRPKGIGLGPLLEAIKRVEKKKKQKFFDRAIEMAWNEPSVISARSNRSRRKALIGDE